LHSIALLAAILPLEVQDLLREPDYSIIREGDRSIVQKPRLGMRQPFTISRHRDRSAAELRIRSLPRLRLNGLFVRFDPASYARTTIADWTAQADAQQIGDDVREIVNRFAPEAARVLLYSTPVYMARLSGAVGHTAEESTNHARFVIYLDPFRASGRLHVAATLLHEATHLDRYRARGFHANRAVAVLPKKDFVLLGLADELAACSAEAQMLRSFLESQANEEARRAVRDAIRNPELNWPVALTVMLGFEAPSREARQMLEARREVLSDLESKAESYWVSRHLDPIDPSLRQTILDWYKHSREWKEISAGRPEWRKAERRLLQSDP
jgi:hypothetical protein